MKGVGGGKYGVDRRDAERYIERVFKQSGGRRWRCRNRRNSVNCDNYPSTVLQALWAVSPMPGALPLASKDGKPLERGEQSPFHLCDWRGPETGSPTRQNEQKLHRGEGGEARWPPVAAEGVKELSLGFFLLFFIYKDFFFFWARFGWLFASFWRTTERLRSWFFFFFLNFLFVEADVATNPVTP